eukprot:3940487-Rhodomonas_salina.2
MAMCYAVCGREIRCGATHVLCDVRYGDTLESVEFIPLYLAPEPEVESNAKKTESPYNLYRECGLLSLISRCWFDLPRPGCYAMSGTEIAVARVPRMTYWY